MATGGATLRLGGQANAGLRKSRVLHMILLVDQSGSMLGDSAQVVDGLNDFMSEMAKPSNQSVTPLGCLSGCSTKLGNSYVVDGRIMIRSSQ